MSSFKDTSSWTKKDGTTLVYSYLLDGKQHDGSSEKEPRSLDMQLERLSILKETSWRLKDKKEPETEAGFFSREYVSALGILDNCRLHAISLDENPNESFSRLEVSIYPAPLDRLQETGTVDEWRILHQSEKPDEGWLKDEIGRLDFHGAGEYYDRSTLFAMVFVSQEKFNDLAQEVRIGGIRSARLRILADLYHFGYEGMGAGIAGHLYNYAILCEDEGTSAFGTPKGVSGHTKARLQEVLLEWSPKLDAATAGRRDDPDEDNFLEADREPMVKDVEKSVARLGQDVHIIRGRIENIHIVLVLLVVIVLCALARQFLQF